MTQAASAKPCDLCTLLADLADVPLAADGGPVRLWGDAQLTVVFVDEPHYPGFTRVIWHGHVKEMTDLSPPDRAHAMWAVWQVESALRSVMAPDKVNLASFGNMTPHVHWHLIPRYADDVHFPQPTWGAAQREPDAAALDARRARLPQLRDAIIANLSD